MKRYNGTEIRGFVTKPLFAKEKRDGKDYSLPRISVVTSSYNQAQFLERTILSVLNQGYPNLEFIVIDGGSTDGSLEIIRKYAPQIDYWVSERDRGHADALNKGFRQATGEILGWLNSDDLYLPGALHAVAEAFHTRRADVVYGNLYYVDPDDRIFEERRLTSFSPSGFLYGGCDLLQPGTFWRRSLYETVGEVSLEYVFSMDAELFVRFVQAGARFQFVREFLACFRLHPRSKTCTISHVRKQENGRIRSALPYRYDSMRAALIRARTKLLRVLHYLVQGDAGWLIRRLKLRLLGSHQNELQKRVLSVE